MCVCAWFTICSVSIEWNDATFYFLDIDGISNKTNHAFNVARYAEMDFSHRVARWYIYKNIYKYIETWVCFIRMGSIEDHHQEGREQERCYVYNGDYAILLKDYACDPPKYMICHRLSTSSLSSSFSTLSLSSMSVRLAASLPSSMMMIMIS